MWATFVTKKNKKIANLVTLNLANLPRSDALSSQHDISIFMNAVICEKI